MSGAISAYSGKVSKLQKALEMLDESDRTAIHNYLSGEAEALKTIKNIKDDATHNLKNYRDDTSFRRQFKKCKKAGIYLKMVERFIHANKTNENNLKRLINKQKRKHLDDYATCRNL